MINSKCSSRKSDTFDVPPRAPWEKKWVDDSESMSLTNAELISLGSFCVSLIAAAFAARSLRNSSKALRLAESDNEEKRMGIDPYLIQARKIVLANNQNFAAFAVSYTNRASMPNTLATVELYVTFVADAGEARQVFLQTERDFTAHIADIKCLEIPINISARASTTGWLVFKLPEYLRGKSMKTYEVAGFTAQGTKVSVVSYLLMDTIFYDKSSGE